MQILKRIGKVFLWSLAAIIGLLLLLWAFHSPIVKWAVKTYSPEHTGRQITLDQFHFNPLNGTITMGGVKVLEAAGDSIFLSVDHIRVNATLYKMIGGFYEITALHVVHPSVRLVQRGERFNFSDLIDRFAGDTTGTPEPPGEPARYALYDLFVDSLNLSYVSDLLPAPLHFVEADVRCPRLRWDLPVIAARVRALGSDGVDLTCDLGLHTGHMSYLAHVIMGNGPCKALEPYVAPYMSIGGLQGLMHADLHMRGTADDALDFSMKGMIGLDGFALNDPRGTRLVGLHRMDLAIDTIDVKQEVYRVRRFVLDSAYLFAELDEQGDNFTRWMQPSDNTASDSTSSGTGYDPQNPFSLLAHYVKLVAENYNSMSYRLDSLALLNATVVFNDFTLEQPFHYSFTGMSLQADDINSSAKEVVLRARSVLNETGMFEAELGLDPATKRNMRFNQVIEGVGLPAFAPYTMHYVAHPIVSGRSRYECRTTVVDNKLHSENHIFVEDFNFGSKENVAGAYNLPVRLAASLLKDADGNIDLDVPVEGDLDDPDYRVWPVVWQVLKNLITKAVAAPANALARSFDADEDDLRAVRFLYLQKGVDDRQKKPLNILARVVKERPEMRIDLVQSGDRAGEAEAFGIHAAKAMFYRDSTGSPLDTTRIEELLAGVNIKSAGFGTWIDGRVGASDEPAQKKCMRLVGQARAEAEVARLWAARKDAVQAYLILDKELPAGALNVRDRVESDTIPSQGQPAFIALYGMREGANAAVP